MEQEVFRTDGLCAQLYRCNTAIVGSGAAGYNAADCLWRAGQLSSGRAKHDVPETVVLRCLDQQQLDKVRLSRSRCPL